jgi:hypothetical protein
VKPSILHYQIILASASPRRKQSAKRRSLWRTALLKKKRAP